MTWTHILIFMFVVGFGLLLSGMWVAGALGVVGCLGLLVCGYANLLPVIGNVCWKTTCDFTLTAIPLFLFMGDIILEGGLSKNFYRGIARYVYWIPGGLLHSNILASGIFSAISGSSVATAAAIGSAAIPEMKAQHYDKKLIYGSLASAGTLGILIPPSIALIIYASLTDQSVVKLFSAAMGPGILLMVLYMAYLFIRALVKKDEFAKVDSSAAKQMPHKQALIGVLPMVLLIVVVLGGIYTGYATPTEAAALGVAMALICGKLFGTLKWKDILKAMKSSAQNTAMILFIMLGAQIFAYVMTATSASREMVSWLVGTGIPKYAMLAIVCIIYIVLGCFMDGNSIQFLTIPILFPVMMEYGFDPIWFGIVLTVLIEIGQITPPMGLNLFVIKGVDKESSLGEIIHGSLPYLIIMCAYVVVLTIFPGLATFAL